MLSMSGPGNIRGTDDGNVNVNTSHLNGVRTNIVLENETQRIAIGELYNLCASCICLISS